MGGTLRSTIEPTRVCRVTWMEAGVSGSPETIHSAPEVKTCRCRPANTARMALSWSDTSEKAIA